MILKKNANFTGFWAATANCKEEFMGRLNERIENFTKAFELFQSAVKAYKSDVSNVIYHLAVVQSFEVCFELGWKVLKDYLHQNGIEVSYPKEAIKEAFSKGTIQNGQIWIDMLKDRNATSHEYNMDKVDKVLEKISTIYFEELCRFMEQTKDFDE